MNKESPMQSGLEPVRRRWIRHAPLALVVASVVGILAALSMLVVVELRASSGRTFRDSYQMLLGTFRTTDLQVDNDATVGGTLRITGVTTFGTGVASFPTTTCPGGQAEIATAADGTSTCAAFGTGSGNISGAGTATDLAIFSAANTIANYAGSTPSACAAGQAVTQPALSASGALTTTCAAFAPAASVSGTLNTIAKFTPDGSSLGNSSLADDGSIVSTSEKLKFGSTAPGAGQQAWFSLGNATTTTQLYMQETDTGHVGTGGNNERISIVADQRGTSDCTASTCTSNGLTVLVSTTRSAGANNLSNLGIICGVSGGQVNECLYSAAGQGGIQVADLAQFGPVTSTDLSSATIEASASVSVTGIGTLSVLGNVLALGNNSSNTIAINGTLTTPVLLMSNSSDNTILRLAQTGAGGNTWSFGSGDTAAATSAGLSIVNNTFGWETLHINQATAGHPGLLEFAGGHTGEGSIFNGSMVPSISGCGTGSPAVLGTDRAGRITEGIGATGCTIGWVNAYTTPSCVCSSRSQLATFTCNPSTTQLVIANTVATGDVVDYVCTELSP
jgi:hypothetical protein